MRLGGLGVVALIAWAFLAGAALAEVKLEDPKHLTWDKTGKNFSSFRSKPAKALMTKAEYQAYQAALKRLDCDPAERILNRAFVRAYPRFARVRPGPHCETRDCQHWGHFSRVNFDGYGFCTALAGLHKTERQLRARNIKPPKFNLQGWQDRADPKKRRPYKNRMVEGRDLDISLIIRKAEGRYIPALLYLAYRLRLGDVFIPGPDVEYYLLQRACFLGHDCTKLRPRLKVLRRQLLPGQAWYIAMRARQRVVLQRPVIHAMLLGRRLVTMPDMLKPEYCDTEPEKWHVC